MNVAKFLRTLVLKNIYELLLVKISAIESFTKFSVKQKILTLVALAKSNSIMILAKCFCLRKSQWTEAAVQSVLKKR